MRMKFYVGSIFILFSLMLPCSKTYGSEDYYTYRGIYKASEKEVVPANYEFLTISKNGVTTGPGLGGAPNGGCNDDSFFCSFSLGLNFAIPFEIDCYGGEWVYEGFKHKILRKDKVKTLGREYAFYVIHVTSEYPQNDNIVFYDKKYGVMAFTMEFAVTYGGSRSVTLYSEGKYGYGHK